MLAGWRRNTFRKKISWPFLSPFLLLGAVSLGLGAALLAARSPALFLIAAWRVGWTSAGLTLLAFALALWLQWRLRANEQRAETSPAWLVRGHGLRFLAWFAGHNLFWTAFGCLSSALWLDLLGPRSWVLIYIAGVLAGVAYTLLGLLFAHRIDILGICWRSPVPRGVPLWAYPGATIVLRDRSEYAMAQDLGCPKSVLQQVIAILDLARAGEAERSVNLWEASRLAAWQKEIFHRFLVLSTLFIVVSGLALVTVAALNTISSSEWQPPLTEGSEHEGVPIETVTVTPSSVKTLTPKPVTGTTRPDVIEDQLTLERMAENSPVAPHGSGENRTTDGVAVPGEASSSGLAKGETGESTPVTGGIIRDEGHENGTAKAEGSPGEITTSEPTRGEATGETAGNAAEPAGADPTSGETVGNTAVGPADADELASGGMAENSGSGGETGQGSPNPGEVAGSGAGTAESEPASGKSTDAESGAKPSQGYGTDNTFVTVSPAPLPPAAQDSSDQPITLEFVPVGGPGDSPPETGTPLSGSPEPVMTGTLSPGATPTPAATLTPVQHLPNWILTLLKQQ